MASFLQLVALLALGISAACMTQVVAEEECDASEVSLLQKDLKVQRVSDSAHAILGNAPQQIAAALKQFPALPADPAKAAANAAAGAAAAAGAVAPAPAAAVAADPAAAAAAVAKAGAAAKAAAAAVADKAAAAAPAAAAVAAAAGASGNEYGNHSCACIGIDQLQGVLSATMSDGKVVPFPADLGAKCEAWDAKSNPKCTGQNPASWCNRKWCYVDPCKCKLATLPKPSNYLAKAMYQGKPVHFSYATCGGTDSYSAEEAKKTESDIANTCAADVDAALWGNENCRCQGIAPKTGTAKVTVGGKQVDFPASTGANCQAWEKGNDPACKSAAPPAYCEQKWCYVDPCSCKSPVTPPKTSSYLPHSKSKGKPVYFSYATCGGTDSWTEGNKEACVNQADEDGCKTKPKCAWDGKACLGKELISMCKSENIVEERDGAWSPSAFIALSCLLLGLF